jgi:hypothetical protein
MEGSFAFKVAVGFLQGSTKTYEIFDLCIRQCMTIDVKWWIGRKIKLAAIFKHI